MAEEPWDIVKDDERKANTLKTYIIFCEDEVSEADYFRFFETDKIKINSIRKQGTKMQNVLKAIEYCTFDESLPVDHQSNSFVFNKNIEIWCVFDRDIDLNGNQNKQNVDFNESIRLAQTKGMKVAWSNDSFELWVLLHFEEVSSQMSEANHRIYYYERLTDLFKNLNIQKELLKRILSHTSFSYKRDLKSKRAFQNIVRPILIENTKVAINRAKVLDNYSSEVDYSNQIPCTKVYLLISELIKTGKKITL